MLCHVTLSREDGEESQNVAGESADTETLRRLRASG